jgi:hypothetical protein
MARECVFCGAPAKSKEHIWPNWAARFMAAEGPANHHLNIVQAGEADSDRSWKQKQFLMTVRAVCATCNHGWMSALEGRLKPFFEEALQGQGQLLGEEFQRDLATWALKTAMMVECAQNPDKPAILPEECPHLFAHGEPSPRVRIWMAAYDGVVSTAVGHMWGLDFAAEQDPDPARQHGEIWGGTVVFGPVVFQLLGSNVPGLLELAEMTTPDVHQLWPYDQPFTWEPTPGLGDGELPDFMDFFLTGLLALGGESPRRARKLP